MPPAKNKACMNGGTIGSMRSEFVVCPSTNSDEIAWTRVIDQDSRWLIASDRVFTGEKHFAPEDTEICYSFYL